jgi:disulfide bond formation protein DsbB
VQRGFFYGVLGVSLVAALHGRWSRFYAVLAALLSAGGIAAAGRQVWLQHLPPDQVPMCGPGLNYLVEAMPLADVIRKVLTGSGECARVDWTLLGASMAEWSLLCFVLLAIWSLALAFRNRR